MSMQRGLLAGVFAVGGSGALYYGLTGWLGVQEVEQKQKLLIPLRDKEVYPSKYTFVIDMDETLLHTSFNSESTGSVAIRPHAPEFLKRVSEISEMVLWTAGTEDYAVLALPLIGPEADLFHHRIYRNPIWWHSGVTRTAPNSKGLRRLNRDLRYTLLVDNATYAVDMEDQENAIVVNDFYNDKSDTELMYVKKILEDLVKSDMEVPAFLKKMVKEGRLLRSSAGYYCMAPTPSRWFW